MRGCIEVNLIERIIEKLYFKIDNNLALYDTLTGCYNYNWYNLIGRKQYDKIDVYVTIIDLNNFKEVNDTNGHEYGNNLLKHIAYEFKCLSLIDKSATVVRYGGDEFIIFTQFDLSRKINKEKVEHVILSYGTYHKRPFESIDYAVSKADKLMYDYKINFKKLNDGGSNEQYI